MATTTPNYGWSVPTSTDLVKDGAVAIETLGDSADATLKALNPETTLGDISYRSATANTNTRLAIGSTGNVLTVSGGVPTWAAPAAGGGMTLLSTTSLSGASTTISSISQSYKNLEILITGVTFASGANVLRIAPNGSTNLVDYAMTRMVNASASTVGEQNSYISTYSGTSFSDANNAFNLTIFNYTSTSRYKPFTYSGSFKQTNPDNFAFISGGGYKSNTAISSLVFSGDIANLSTGTVLVYGVN
jgi:hypothetical protein